GHRLDRIEARRIAAKQLPTLTCAGVSRKHSLGVDLPLAAGVLAAAWPVHLRAFALLGLLATIFAVAPTRVAPVHSLMRGEGSPHNSDQDKTAPYRLPPELSEGALK